MNALIIQNVSAGHQKTLGMGTIEKVLPAGATIRPYKEFAAPVLRDRADSLEYGKTAFFVSNNPAREVFFRKI